MLSPVRLFTTVDFPCATCPIVPTLIVACLEITSGDNGVSFEISNVSRFWIARPVSSRSAILVPVVNLVSKLKLKLN